MTFNSVALTRVSRVPWIVCWLNTRPRKEKHIAITFTLQNHKWNCIWMWQRWRDRDRNGEQYRNTFDTKPPTYPTVYTYVYYGTISLLYFFRSDLFSYLDDGRFMEIPSKCITMESVSSSSILTFSNEINFSYVSFR